MYIKQKISINLHKNDMSYNILCYIFKSNFKINISFVHINTKLLICHLGKKTRHGKRQGFFKKCRGIYWSSNQLTPHLF